MFTDNLDNYHSYSETSSCYLDGRYFNKVFHKYPGLILEPMEIFVKMDKRSKEIKTNASMARASFHDKYIGLLRVVINTKQTRHSSLVLIDFADKKIWRFDPLGRESPYFDLTNRVIEDYLDNFMDFDMYVIGNEPYDTKNPSCDKSGFCVAYIIKFAYDYLNGRPFDPTDIRKFAAMIEHKYGPLPEHGKDIEYGRDGPQPGNVLLGGLAGGAIGGLVTGSPGGLLLGGLAGAGIGALV